MKKASQVFGVVLVCALGATTFAIGAPSPTIRVQPVPSHASSQMSVGLDPAIISDTFAGTCLVAPYQAIDLMALSVAGGSFDP
jgi:hypothetical protein